MIDTPSVPPPHRWLPPLAAWLSTELMGARVEGVLSGRGWLSLRIDGRFLWLVAEGSLRAAWLAERAIPLRLSESLGKHHKSPFAPLLQGQVFLRTSAPVDDSGEPAALRLEFEGGRSLSIRFWPRPGVLWVEDADGKVQSASPPDAAETGAGLRPPRDAEIEALLSWDPQTADAHAEHCARALEQQLETATLRRLRDATRGRRRKAERLAEALAKESEEAHRQAGLRTQADLLAANLHRVRIGMSELVLDDFEGQPQRLELDPALPPSSNLEKLYRRAGRAERKQGQLERRREEVARDLEEACRAEIAVQQLDGLEAAVQLAQELGVELRPRAPGEHRGQSRRRAPRLPYRIFELSTGREVWVGRGAKDNDELTFRHAAPQDLWFHAGGVEGSHVVLRHLGRPPSALEEQAAAQLAALFSKAKGSTTVPVWVTQRRHVRKPRKAAPGSVVPERVRSLFVEPVEPPGSWKRREE